MTPANVLEEGFDGGRPHNERIQVILQAEAIIFAKIRFGHDNGSRRERGVAGQFPITDGKEIDGDVAERWVDWSLAIENEYEGPES